MNVDMIRKQVKAEPFQPFTIHMADGREIPVPHPEFILVPPTSRFVVVYRDKGFDILDTLLATGVGVDETSPPSSDNTNNNPPQ